MCTWPSWPTPSPMSPAEDRRLRARGRARVGTSGWQYDHWRGDFYPASLPKRLWFAHYAACFDTVEVDATFYRVPTREVFTAWKAQAPSDFRYALKFSRFATHRKKLRDPEQTLPYFLERSAALGDRTGPLLLQLPPRWRADPERLRAFLSRAPRRLRWAVEVRDPSWLCAPVYRVLSEHGAALCIHDLLPEHPRLLTADFTYLRYHGVAYGGSYSPRALSREARWIVAQLEQGIDVYAFFNNDLGGHAVRNARSLREELGIPGRPTPA